MTNNYAQPKLNAADPTVKTPAQPKPGSPTPAAKPAPAKPKRKLELDVNDIDTVLERKISPG